MFTARVIDAAEAERIGLVNAVVAKAELDAHVAQVAADIAKLAPLSLRAAKFAVADPHSTDAIEAARRCFSSDDYAEGIRAHGEKRPPVFRGR